MIIAIEGNTGTGKTLVYDYLKTKGYVGIKEYSFYIREDALINYPQFPPRDMNTLITSHKTWEIIEKRRASQATDAKRDYVLDRSFLSIFAFEYAKKIHKLIYDCENLAKLYMELYIYKVILIPDVVIHLKSSEQNILTNRQNLVNPFLYDPLTISSISKFINEFGIYLCSNNYFEIENNMEDKSKLYKIVDEVLSNTTDTDQNKKDVFVNLLEKIGKI